MINKFMFHVKHELLYINIDIYNYVLTKSYLYCYLCFTWNIQFHFQQILNASTLKFQVFKNKYYLVIPLSTPGNNTFITVFIK